MKTGPLVTWATWLSDFLASGNLCFSSVEGLRLAFPLESHCPLKSWEDGH